LKFEFHKKKACRDGTGLIFSMANPYHDLS